MLHTRALARPTCISTVYQYYSTHSEPSPPPPLQQQATFPHPPCPPSSCPSRENTPAQAPDPTTQSAPAHSPDPSRYCAGRACPRGNWPSSRGQSSRRGPWAEPAAATTVFPRYGGTSAGSRRRCGPVRRCERASGYAVGGLSGKTLARRRLKSIARRFLRR